MVTVVIASLGIDIVAAFVGGPVTAHVVAAMVVCVTAASIVRSGAMSRVRLMMTVATVSSCIGERG